MGFVFKRQLLFRVMVLLFLVSALSFFFYTSDKGEKINSYIREDHGELSVYERTVTPQMFGAKADGIHDDTEAIRKACRSGADTLYFPEGTYMINIEHGQDKKKDNHFFITSINHIIGESRDKTTIKLGKGNGDADGYKGYEAIFSFSGKDAHPEIRNLTFDFNYADNPITQYTSNHVDVEHNGQQMAINAYRVSSLIVENCIFLDHSGTNCIDYRANAESDTLYCIIRNCEFLKVGAKSFYKGDEAYHDCSTLSLHCDSKEQRVNFYCYVENNLFEGIDGNAFDVCECSADSFVFRNNRITGYVVGVMPLTTNPGTKAIIESNIFDSVAKGIGIWSCNIDLKKEIGSIGFDSLVIRNNRIKIDVEKFIQRPQFSTLMKKKGNIYPGDFYGAICGMGSFTKSINKILVDNNYIEYEKIQYVSNNDITDDVNLFNGAVFGLYNLFSKATKVAICNEISFCNNTIRNPLSTIIRLTPFNEIGKFVFNGNTVTNSWTCTQGALINAGLISIYPACYDGSETIKWGEFIIENNNIDFDYKKHELATVFIGIPEKKANLGISSLRVSNNLVKAPLSRQIRFKKGFFDSVTMK